MSDHNEEEKSARCTDYIQTEEKLKNKYIHT